jgi:hypothetical protein
VGCLPPWVGVGRHACRFVHAYVWTIVSVCCCIANGTLLPLSCFPLLVTAGTVILPLDQVITHPSTSTCACYILLLAAADAC